MSHPTGRNIRSSRKRDFARTGFRCIQSLISLQCTQKESAGTSYHPSSNKHGSGQMLSSRSKARIAKTTPNAHKTEDSSSLPRKNNILESRSALRSGRPLRELAMRPTCAVRGGRNSDNVFNITKLVIGFTMPCERCMYIYNVLTCIQSYNILPPLAPESRSETRLAYA